MLISTILQEAKKNIEAGWTQNEFARNKDGQNIWSFPNDNAVCYCLVGAYHKVLGRNTYDYEIDVDNYLKKAIEIFDPRFKVESETTRFITAWNDCTERRKVEVLHVYDLAIEFAKIDEMVSV